MAFNINDGGEVTLQNPKGTVTASTENYSLTVTTGIVQGGGLPSMQEKSVSYTPSETAQSETITADVGYGGLEQVNVSVGAISSTYVGSGIAQHDSSDLSASGATVTAPAGYYASNATKTITSGSATPASSITATGASLSTGSGTLTLSKTVSNTPVVSAGYVSSGTAGNSNVSLTASVTTKGSDTITPTTSSQTAVAANTYVTGNVTVSAMPSGTAGTPTATKGAVSNHSVSVTPSVTNTTGYITGGTKTGTAVSVSASELVSGTLSITSSGTKDVTNYASASVSAGGATASATKGAVSNHSVTVTPSVTRTAGYVTAGTATGTAVTVSASELVSGTKSITQNGNGIDVANYSAVDVSVSGGGGNDFIITASWDSVNSKWVLDKTFAEISAAHYAGKTIAVVGADYGTADGTYIEDSPNDFFSWWVMQQNGDDLDYWSYMTDTHGTTLGFNDTFIYPNFTSPTRTYTPTESQQTDTITFDPSSYNGIQQVGVTVNAVSSTYVGSGVTRRDSTDLSASGSTVTVPAGYYANSASKSVSSGNDFIITISYNSATQLWEPDCTVYEWQDAYTDGKDIVLNGDGCSIAGWIYDDDYSFFYAVWTASSVLNAVDMCQYMFTTQGVEEGGMETYILPTFDSPTRTYTPTTSQQTDTITFDPSTYNGIQQVGVTVNAMPSMTLPSSASGTSSGTRKATISSSTSTQYINIPTGYNGTAQYYQLSAPTAMTLPTTTSSTGSGTSKLAVTPGTSNKYINIPTGYNSAAAYYTVNGDANLVAGNIKSGTTIFGVQGTYSGGGSSMNAQAAQSTTRSTSTSGTQVISLTCTTAGTYDVYWTTFRSSTSGTWGSRLYIGGTAYETMNTSGWSNHVQNRHVSNVSIGANQAVAVYVQSRGSSYYGYVGTLTIVQSS